MTSSDRWRTDKDPLLVSPHASRPLRYLDVVQWLRMVRHYYREYARPDGSHELRASSVARC